MEVIPDTSRIAQVLPDNEPSVREVISDTARILKIIPDNEPRIREIVPDNYGAPEVV